MLFVGSLPGAVLPYHAKGVETPVPSFRRRFQPPRDAWVTLPLLAALLALVAVHAVLARQALRGQLAEANRQSAAALAASLGREGSDMAAWQALATAHFTAGRTRLLRLEPADGIAAVEMQAPPRGMAAPDWFVTLLPVPSEPGRASVVDDSQRNRGAVQVTADAALAQDALWLATVEGLAAALLAWVLAALAMLGWRRVPVEVSDSTLDDAPSSVPAVPVEQASLAEQVALLQRQAQQDPVTGLPLRRHFNHQLQQRLGDAAGSGVALLLVRVLHLAALNTRLGHDATDQWLRAVADVLQTYVERVPGTFAGRLNGSDFALCLPVTGVAQETAESLRAALAAAPALRTGSAEVAVGGVDGLRDTTASLALAAADGALARAEDGADLDGLPVVEQHRPGPDAPSGESAWREQIAAALEEGRVELEAEPVRDRDGRERHLGVRLRMPAITGEASQPAERWLAQARRSHLMPQVDLAALDLALAAVADDGRTRALTVSPASLSTPGFIGDVGARLGARPSSARRLVLECSEGLHAGAGVATLVAAAAAWRPLGVRLGVEYSSAVAPQFAALRAAGIGHVKVDARHLQGVAGEAAVQGYAQSLVALVQGQGLVLVAAGIADEADLHALWQLGFDAASGAAVKAPVPA